MAANRGRTITQAQYDSDFQGLAPAAFEKALDARRFEIQMYWTRTTYFSTLNAAALAGFFLLQSDRAGSDQRLFGFVIAGIGFLLCLGWALANKGSKFWHENWENHVQLLERHVVGPLHKTLLTRPMQFDSIWQWMSQALTGPSQFSVSKINSMISWFLCVLWFLLMIFVIPKASPCSCNDVDVRYIWVGAVVLVFACLLAFQTRSWIDDQEHASRRITSSIQ